MKHSDIFTFDVARATPADLRQVFRSGAFTGHTGGMALGRLQGNLAIVPAAHALDFARFCQRNPRPCPLIGISDTGNPDLWMLGDGIDVRTDLPNYYVYRNGVLEGERTDIKDLWREDSVAFLLGCSFSFEAALAEAGLPLRHMELGTLVPMYKTNIALTPAGPFRGTTVVSMRPMPAAKAELAREVTGRFPGSHGAPLQIGDPQAIGIADVDQPDWGDPTEFRDGEIPVFWACGVTPQNVLLGADIDIVITHKPGAMLITDLPSR